MNLEWDDLKEHIGHSITVAKGETHLGLLCYDCTEVLDDKKLEDLGMEGKE